MFVECDQVAVPLPLWRAVQAGDMLARDTLRSTLTGMVLYSHALALDPAVVYTTLTVREVGRALGDNLTLTIGFDG